MGGRQISVHRWSGGGVVSVLLLGLLLSACGGSGAGQASPALPVGTAQPAGPSFAASLPPLSSLHGGAPRRGSAATPYNLLNSAPLSTSPGGSATWSASSLSLTPSLNHSLAWAVFGLQGFPGDGSIYPQSVDSDGGPLWVGLSNYAKGVWEWRQVKSNGSAWTQAYGPSSGYVSPGGATYVALVRTLNLAHTYTALTVTASASLFAPPAGSLSVVSTAPTVKYPVTFDLSGSVAGDGNITSISFIPENGAPPVDLGTTLPLPADYTYTYTTIGSKTASLTILDDKGGSDTKTAMFTVQDTEKELLLIYNSSIPDSQDLAHYYASPETGRAIDPDYLLPLPLADSASFSPAIDRPTYDSTIRDPIKAFLDGHSAVKASVKYLVLCKGVPWQLSDGGGGLTAKYASVDSELCCLYSDNDGVAPGYPLDGALINDPKGFDFLQHPDAFYEAGDVGFSRGQFKVDYDPTWDQDPDQHLHDVQFPLDYLVGRIDAYDYSDARAMLDRARQADTSGTGWVIFDSNTGTYGQDSDTMVDPVWPYTTSNNPRPPSGQQLLTAAGFNLYTDVSSALVTSSTPDLDPATAGNVIAYCSWGVHGGSYPHGADYILQDLGWTYRPGACFESYESFNANNFDGSDIEGKRAGQGQICDFIRMGGTVALGNVYEPYTVGCGDERWIFDRYLEHGDRWIEAAYKGLRWVSWQEVVIGDPLCRVKP
jgi:uncharacterized protein (TIGR03790 family)